MMPLLLAHPTPFPNKKATNLQNPGFCAAAVRATDIYDQHKINSCWGIIITTPDAVQKVISTVWNGGYHFLKTPDEICGGCNFLHKPGIHISHKDRVFIPLPPSISAEKCHRLGDSQIGILGTPGSISRLICVW